MKLTLIAAMNEQRVIGLNGALPWRIPADLKRFRALTKGHAVIMGRKTWDSLGRPLPDRLNIVITRRPDFEAQGAVAVGTLEEALGVAQGPSSPNHERCFVIGGGEIYRLALPLADELELTWVKYAGEGDAWFPEWNRELFRESRREDFDEGCFVSYSRVG
jgi:dihydrofolate reductase